jgi:hypothetical protein
MKRFISIMTGIFFVIIFSAIGFGQVSDTTATTDDDAGDFVDLTGDAVRITIEPERPRVNIIADRIKPDFDMMSLDRSYIPELTGKGEKIMIVDPKAPVRDDKIDVKKIVNRSR